VFYTLLSSTSHPLQFTWWRRGGGKLLVSAVIPAAYDTGANADVKVTFFTLTPLDAATGSTLSPILISVLINLSNTLQFKSEDYK
jgi:hypothetical protein